MKWAYHGTTKNRLPGILRHGLVPGSSARLDDFYALQEWLYFSDNVHFSTGYGGADEILRFPWPSSWEVDRHEVTGRILPHAFRTRNVVPASQIQKQSLDGTWISIMNISELRLLEAFIREEIGRNFHTVDPAPNTWEDFQDYEIECFPTETGAYIVDVSFQGKKLSPTARFPNETEAKHFARMVVDKHRVNAMNNK